MNTHWLSPWFKWLLPFFGIVIFAILNLSFSGMGVLGVLINIIALLWFGAYFIWPHPKVLIGFFAVSQLLGPFVLFNFTDIDLETIGRFDFIIALFIGLIIILQKGSIDRYFLFFIFMFILIMGWGLLLHAESRSNYLEFFDVWFGIAGRIAIGLVLVMLVKAIINNFNGFSGQASEWVGIILLSLFIFHIVFSYLQLLVPITLRSNSIDSGLNLFGYNFMRPVGFLEASYVYGSNTVGFWWILNLVRGGQNSRFLIFLIIIALPVSFLGTRSIALGLVLFLILYLSGISKNLKYILLPSIIIIFLLVIPFNLIEILNTVDQSNSTKILLGYQLIFTWISDFPSYESFLGYGFDQASLLAANNDFGILASLYEASYDNRINNGLGFPVHNVYLQLLFEYGLFSFIAVIWLIWRGLVNILLRRIDSPTAFFWCISVTHYAVHNGIFSPLLILPLLIVAFPERLRISHSLRS